MYKKGEQWWRRNSKYSKGIRWKPIASETMLMSLLPKRTIPLCADCCDAMKRIRFRRRYSRRYGPALVRSRRTMTKSTDWTVRRIRSLVPFQVRNSDNNPVNFVVEKEFQSFFVHVINKEDKEKQVSNVSPESMGRPLCRGIRAWKTLHSNRTKC